MKTLRQIREEISKKLNTCALETFSYNSPMLILLIYALIGVLAGFLGGLLGIGGGLIVVPALLAMFHLQSLPDTYAMQVAIGTSLGAMIFTSASSAWTHYRQRGVLWPLFCQLAPAVIVGAILGAVVADYLPSHSLKRFFGLSVILLGAYFLFPMRELAPRQPTPLILVCLGTLIGGFSSLLGIGGGIMTVPVLTILRIPLRNAIATSALIGFCIAFIGALSFLLLGFSRNTYEGSVGYLYLPAFVIISITSLISASYGAKMTYILPVMTLRRLFGALLIMMGLWMLLA
jgi:uncharacterized protein